MLTCQLDATLAANVGYTVTIAASSSDLAGNPMGAAVTSSFTTGSNSNPVGSFDAATAIFDAAVFGD